MSTLFCRNRYWPILRRLNLILSISQML